MYITLNPPCRQAFLAALSRKAAPSFTLRLQGEALELIDVTPSQAGWALSFGAFPVYEACLARAMAERGFGFLEREERTELVALALALAAADVYRGTPASGPGRQRRIRRMLEQELSAQGRLDFNGFCRFRLPGHLSYLRYLLECAAAELIARQDEEEYLRLLAETSAPLPDSRDWQLEFFAGGGFELKNGEAAEGGRWPGREDALIADLIARRPRRLTINGLAYAPLRLTACLEQVLGERLEDASPKNALDKEPNK